MDASRRVARLRIRRQRAAQTHSATASIAAGYVRVSSDEQAEKGYGLESQERAVRAFAESQGYQLAGVFSDPGVSGATAPAQRPGFGQLLKLAEERKFSVLLVWKFDRLARQIVYAVTAVQELSERFGVAVRSVTEPIDCSTAMGRTIFAVLAGMAEQERHAITERTWHGRREKASHGRYAGGSPPYGYRPDGNGGIAIDASEADIVKRMFSLRQAGMSYRLIAHTLNAEGHRTRRGKPWRHGGIAYMMDNPKYKGAIEYLFRWSGAEQHVLRTGAHEAIIDKSPNL